MPADLARRAASTVARMAAGRRLLLLLDFDGTLCEFDPDPAAVWLAAARRDLLLGLQRSRAITLGIVSGRRLDDVRRRTRLAPGAYYAGLHGLEIEGDGVHFVHPDVATTRTVVERLVVRLETEFADLKGVFVENKGLSVAAHYRDAQPEVGAQVPPAVERVARDELASGRLRVMRGACMVELLPNIPWNKGDAVRWIAGRVAAGAAADAPAPGSRVRTANREPRTANVDRVFTVYVGDDVTDEDAFRALRSGGLSIAASSRASGADLTLDGPPDVEAFLRALSRTLGPHQSETCGSGDQEDVNRRSGDQEDAERRPNGGRS